MKSRTSDSSTGWACLAGSLALLLGWPAPVAAQDGNAQKIKAEGLTFSVPSTWKAGAPSTAMRKAQLKIAPVQGDEEAAELIVFVFPGGAGGVDANVARWEKTFKDKDGNAVKAEVKKVTANGSAVSRVELAGHYYPTSFPGQPRQADHDNYRLLGAILTTDDSGYFLRLVGPEKTVQAAKADFDKLIASMQLDKK